MLKLTGAAAILLSAVLAACGLLRDERERLDGIAELRSALERLRREICERMSPLPEIAAGIASAQRDGCAAGFFRALSARLPMLGEAELTSIWTEAAAETLAPLGDESVRAVQSLAEQIGGSDAAVLSKAAEECVSVLAGAETRGRERLAERARLTLGAALCAGAFAVIMLV